MPDLWDINAGDLRFRGEIQEVQGQTKDSKGQMVPNWVSVATRWMNILPASGQYFVASDQIRNSISHKIIIRYCEGLTPRNRIKFGNRIFNILSILNEGELKVRHTILATEVI